MITDSPKQMHIPMRSTGVRSSYLIEQFAQTDIRFAHQLTMGQLADLAASHIEPIRRLETIEKLKKSIRFLQEELAKHYCGRPLPLAHDEDAVWNDVIQLWQESIRNYQLCFRACHEGDAAIAPHAAFVVARCMRETGNMMLDYQRVCRQPPGTVWRSLHELSLFAESNGLAGVRIRDRFENLDPDSSCLETYVQILRAHQAQTRDAQCHWQPGGLC